MDEEAVITARDVPSIYEVPLSLAGEGLDRIVLERLHLPQTEARMDKWQDLVDRIRQPEDEVTLHFVGKYTDYEDSYKSINEALYHGGFRHRLKVNLRFVEAEALEQADGMHLLDDAVGIWWRGFGDRGQPRDDGGRRGCANAQNPLFRHLLRLPVGGRRVRAPRAGLAEADSTEVTETPRTGIYKLRDLPRGRHGGTMRLGSYACRWRPTHSHSSCTATKSSTTSSPPVRVNCLYEKTLTDRGLRIVGRSLDGKFVELGELPTSVDGRAVPSGIQVQTPAPHPLFAGS